MKKRVPKWKRFEQLLDRLDLGTGSRFTVVELAARIHEDPSEVSNWVQCYLDAQRAKQSQTRFVLSRRHRTSAAIWTVGRRLQDARRVPVQLGDDVLRRIERAVAPDLEALAERTGPETATKIRANVEAAVNVFAQQVELLINSM